MNTRERKPKRQIIPEAQKPPIADRVHSLRERLWGAMAIASVIEYAGASALRPEGHKPDFQGAAGAMHDILNAVTGDMEAIVEELATRATEAAEKPAEIRARKERSYRHEQN